MELGGGRQKSVKYIAFQEAKDLLTKAPVLTHSAGDASAYGIGAHISHVYPDESEQPIACASRTLSAADKNYGQIEKEAILLECERKFHLYERKFVLVTDHKPLTSVFGPKRGIPTLVAARLQRWALILSAYTYTY